MCLRPSGFWGGGGGKFHLENCLPNTNQGISRTSLKYPSPGQGFVSILLQNPCFLFLQSHPKGARKLVPRESCRKYFWHFLTIFDFFCPARKMSKSGENMFDTFWRFLMFLAPFRWPLLRSADFCKSHLSAKSTRPQNFLSTNSGRQPRPCGQGSNAGKLWKFSRKILKTPFLPPCWGF